MASRSHPLISTIRHRPVNRTTDFGAPLAMRRQNSHRRDDRSLRATSVPGCWWSATGATPHRPAPLSSTDRKGLSAAPPCRSHRRRHCRSRPRSALRYGGGLGSVERAVLVEVDRRAPTNLVARSVLRVVGKSGVEEFADEVEVVDDGVPSFGYRPDEA
jgi:hypothetical protein